LEQWLTLQAQGHNWLVNNPPSVKVVSSI
jgi:hypothetical protein